MERTRGATAARLSAAVLIATAPWLWRPAVVQARSARRTGTPAASVNRHPDDRRWIPRASLVQGAVFAACAAGKDGRVYVISGHRSYDSASTAATHIYDPAADTWSSGKPISIPRSTAGAAAGPDGRIYVLGGRVPRDQANTTVEVYDPRADVWSRSAPMPTQREALGAVAARGRDGRVWIYAIGGRNDLRQRTWHQLATVDAFDPVSGRWKAVASMPTARHGFAVTLGPDGRIYVIGGTDSDVFAMCRMEIYDPREDSWSLGPPMPYGQECAAATFTPGRDGEVLVFGGWGQNKVALTSAAAFSPRTNTWRPLPPLDFPRAAAGAVTVAARNGRTRIFLIGGTGEDGSGKLHPANSVETSTEEYLFGAASRPQ